MHRGGRADLLIGPSERAPALRVGQEADPYKSGYGLKNGAPGSWGAIILTAREGCYLGGRR